MNVPSTLIQSCGISDVGLIRLNNEDVWARLPRKQFFILADGMGGHAAGEVAASETVLKLCEWAKAFPLSSDLPKETVLAELDLAIRKTNEWVFHLASKEKKMEGMGTTLCVAWVIGDALLTAHVGDSRIYRVRKDRITLLTQDHSLRDELIARGELDESLGPTFPYKNVITRAIGTQSEVVPETNIHSVKPGDLYFLCSDGLTDALPDNRILEIIRTNDSIQEIAEHLVDAVKQAGGTDNITILLFQLPDNILP